ncbi:hypothetical protein RHMOL_Rhmol13G0033900 [Rhododendron molle]|uniref:Uncharacterized protein n=1 Tax=Rhododendron molle TaxID=49168 RepID=A0ACC0L3A9_RHOML|nr:hypothetical protein RHMOL_Rhmol13G0033900 [Rhododendron molle]
MRARKKSPAIAVKKTIDQKEDDDGETQIKETEQEKNDIETPQKRRASQKSPVKKTQSTRITRNQDDDGEIQIKEAEQEKSNIETPQKGRASKKSPVKKTQSRRITRALTKREIRTTRVSKKMETTIEIKKKHVQKSDKNKQTGNEEEDEEDEEKDEEEDEKESEEDEEEDKEDVEDVEEDEEEDKFVKYWLCEHTSIMTMQQSKDHCPRFMKWDMSDLPEALARTPLESLNPEMVNDAELEPNNEKEKKLLHFLDQIEVESDVKDDDTRKCSLDHDGSKSENDEGVEETNNDTNNLISDLLKEIDRLKEESKEKDKVIQTLQQKIAELEKDHVPYQDAAEQIFDYETEVGTVHVEKGILQEEIVQKEVEIGGLYVNNDLLEEKLEKSEKDKASLEDGLDDIVTHMVTQEYHVRKTSLHKYVCISVCISDKERDKEKRQEDEESKEGGVDRSISERVEIATELHDDGLDDMDKEGDKEKRQEDEESKEGGVDRSISERVEIATGLHDDGLDDMDKEGDIKKRQEDLEGKEGGVDLTVSERIEIATGLHDEILPDEVIDKTICQIFKDTQEGERKEKKKRKREQDDIDPPSMVKDLKGKGDRTVNTEEGFIYYRKNQKERKKSNSVFEMTKLFNYISKEDMELLDTIYEFEKGDKKSFVWHNQVNNDTVTIEDILNLLNEGDIGNTCIDGLTYILERREEKTARTHENCFYITSTCWVCELFNIPYLSTENRYMLSQYLMICEIHSFLTDINQRKS